MTVVKTDLAFLHFGGHPGQAFVHSADKLPVQGEFKRLAVKIQQQVIHIRIGSLHKALLLDGWSIISMITQKGDREKNGYGAEKK